MYTNLQITTAGENITMLIATPSKDMKNANDLLEITKLLKWLLI